MLRSFSSKIYAHVKGLGGQQEQEAAGVIVGSPAHHLKADRVAESQSCASGRGLRLRGSDNTGQRTRLNNKIFGGIDFFFPPPPSFLSNLPRPARRGFVERMWLQKAAVKTHREPANYPAKSARPSDNLQRRPNNTLKRCNFFEVENCSEDGFV